MMTDARFAYGQPRLQARLAALPTDEEWQRLAAARTLAAFIEETRFGALQAWTKGFSPLSGVHDLERGLRAQARELVDEVADWVPVPWRAAVLWTAWVPLLPLFEHLNRGAAMPDWAASDYRLRSLLGDDGALAAEALGREGLSSLLGLPETETVAGRWYQGWRERWPACGREHRNNLEGLARLVARHLADFRRAGADAAWDLRVGLRSRLVGLFHQRLLQPAAVFSYVALALLDLERLRGELIRRSLFGDREML